MRSRIRSCLREDTGASLVIALALMVVAGIVMAAILYVSESNIRFAAKLMPVDSSSADIDNALQSGVNQIRGSTYNNALGSNCNIAGLQSTVAPAAQTAAGWGFFGPNTSTSSLAPNMLVTCEPKADTGAQTPRSTGTNPKTWPTGSMLALGTASRWPWWWQLWQWFFGNSTSQGIVVNTPTASTLKVSGNVFSNSDISLTTAGSKFDSGGGTIGAVGNCSTAGGRTFIPLAGCGLGARKAAADPSYPQPSGTPDLMTVPTCPATGAATVKLSAGYYDDASALNTLMNCSGHTIWFQPGTYYFDFHNGEGGGPTGSPVWTINNPNARIVGGTPVAPGSAGGWNPDAATRDIPKIGEPVTGVRVPTCVSPAASTRDNGGVEFVFGGQSQLVVTAGQMEICGQYHADSAPVAIYGAKTGNYVIQGPTTFTPTASAAGWGNIPFINPGYIYDSNQTNYSTATLSAGDNAGVVLQAYSGPNLPTGSVLTAARLNVVQKQSARSAVSALTATILDKNGNALGAPFPLTRCGQPRCVNINLTSSPNVLSTVADYVRTNGLTGTGGAANLQVQIQVASTASVVESVRSATLTLTWQLPGIRSQAQSVGRSQNCLVRFWSPCNFITFNGNSGSSPRFFVTGTTYAPNAAVRVNFPVDTLSSPGLGFSVGLIARTISLNGAYSKPIAERPPDPAANAIAPLVVYFRAYTCSVGAACSTSTAPPAGGWLLAGTAQATYTDVVPGSPVANNRAVIVNSWRSADPILNKGVVVPTAPTVTPVPADSVTLDTATLPGILYANGSAVTSVNCNYSVSADMSNPTTVPATPNTAGAGDAGLPVSCDVSGLAPEKLYFYTLDATNGKGSTTSSPILNFTTLGIPPTIDGATVNGSPVIGAVLTAVPGTVTGTPTPDESYQWQSSADGVIFADMVDANGDPITGVTYTPVATDCTSLQPVSCDLGKYLGVVITETNGSG
ncbi:MAG: hypothetical protein WCP28_01055, partial [Actinomycetes bacterium]